MCWSMWRKGLRTARVYIKVLAKGGLFRGRSGASYLLLNMVKVYTKLLEQRRLAIVTFCGKGSQPSCSQATVLAHATRHASSAAKAAGREARAGIIGAGEAVRRLLGSSSARDGVGRIGRRVELEVLCVASLIVAVGGGAALLATVVVGHSAALRSSAEVDYCMNYGFIVKSWFYFYTARSRKRRRRAGGRGRFVVVMMMWTAATVSSGTRSGTQNSFWTCVGWRLAENVAPVFAVLLRGVCGGVIFTCGGVGRCK